MPRLSVIVPAHDAADTIGLAVRSCLRSLPGDSEVVVLDDGSTDRTAEILASLESPRLRVMTSASPSGVAGALNRLLDSTDSELVARMDADDVNLPGRLRHGAARVTRGDDLVFAAVMEWAGGVPRPNAPISISPEAFPLHLLVTNPVCHPTMVARRAALVRLGGYRDVPSEDYDLWLRAASEGLRLRRDRRWGLLYRHSAGQVTASGEWLRASRADPALAASYADLSDKVLGRRLPRIVVLPGLPRDEREAFAADLSGRVREAARRLAPVERLFLTRKLDARIRRALSDGRRLDEASSPGGPLVVT